jgi:hypothetical protein
MMTMDEQVVGIWHTCAIVALAGEQLAALVDRGYVAAIARDNFSAA